MTHGLFLVSEMTGSSEVWPASTPLLTVLLSHAGYMIAAEALNYCELIY